MPSWRRYIFSVFHPIKQAYGDASTNAIGVTIAAMVESVGGGMVEEFRQELTLLRERLTKLANDLGVKLGAN